MSSNEFGPVKPDNRPRRQRRDPDDDAPRGGVATATPPPPAPAPEPVTAVQPQHRPTEPGPHDPLPQPPGPPQPQPAPHATPGALAARTPDPAGGTLASVLTAPNHRNGHAVSDGVAALAGLAGMASRPVDPYADWVGDGTRLPRFLSEAVRLYARLIGRKTQEVMRDAMLGVSPIPDDVLDAAFLNCYSYPRDQYDPEAYR